MTARKANDLERRLGKWPGGANNVADLRSLQSFERPAVRSAENVDIDAGGKPRRRGGYSLISAGSAHSMWAPDEADWGLAVQAGELRRIYESGAIEPVALVHPLKRMAFTEAAGWIFGSNGQTRFIIDEAGIRPWGVEDPASQPSLSSSSESGGLAAGQYQVAATFLDGRGQESGTGKAATITVPEGGAILAAAIPQPAEPHVQRVRLYCSSCNGDVLYSVADLPVGASTYVIGVADIEGAGRSLSTQFCERVPPSRLLMAYRGRIYFVPEEGDGTRLFYTHPLMYGLYRQDQGYLPLPGRIAGVVPVLEGFYVGTEKQTVYFSGDDPATFTRRTLDAHGMVPGTATRVRGAAFGAETIQTLTAVWWSTNGELIRGDSGGFLTPISRNRLALPAYSGGAVLHRERDGISQLINVLSGPKATDAGFGARDRAVAQIVRNGITL